MLGPLAMILFGVTKTAVGKKVQTESEKKPEDKFLQFLHKVFGEIK